MRSVLLVAALLLVGPLAQAQPGRTQPRPGMTQPQPHGRKSPTIAVALSVGVPLAGAIAIAAPSKDGVKALGFVAMYFGPSMGVWYAGKSGGLGLGLRTLSLATAFGGFLIVATSEGCDDLAPCATTKRDVVAGTLLFGSAGLWIGSSIYDVVLAKRAADYWNNEHALTLTPGLVGTSGHRAPGLVVSGRF